MIEIKSEKKNYSIVLPTDIKEFTPEVLNNITANVQLPKWHGIIALCYRTKLFDIAINVTQKKEQTLTIHVLLAKASSEDLENINAAVGNKLVLDRSTIERGIHLSLPTMIGVNNVSNYIREDDALRQRLLKGGDGSDDTVGRSLVTDTKAKSEKRLSDASPEVYVVEFKIIPLSDVSASIPVDAVINDPFKKIDSGLVN